MKKKIFLLLMSLGLFASDITDAQSSGANLGNMAKGKLGSKSGISSNISSPLQSKTNLTTLDNSTSFTANIDATCGKSNNNGVYLKFSSSTDNVLSINLKHDKNGDGTYDYSSTFGNISHICGGGVKKKDGTYHKWDFNPTTKAISLIGGQTRLNLESCYCILNSCNYGGYSRDIADNVAGDIIAVVGASSVANYSLGIDRYDATNRIYYLYVKDNTSCTNNDNLGNDYTNTNPQNYYQTQNDSALEYTDVMARDKNNTSSLYYITKNQNDVLINSSSGNNNISYTDYKTCTILRNPYNNNTGTTAVSVNDNCSSYESNSSCSLNRESICDYGGKNCIDTVLNFSSTSYTVPVHCIDFDEDFQVCDNGSSIYKVSKASGAKQNIYYSAKAYFYTERIYDCGTNSANFNSAKTDNVIASTSKSGNLVNYNSLTGTSESITLGNYDSCQIKYCSVKNNNAVSTVEYSDGTTNKDTQDGVSTIGMNYKECTKLSTGSYTCPLSAGEVLVEDCSCSLGMNGVGTTLGYISAIEEIANDFTCSTN